MPVRDVVAAEGRVEQADLEFGRLRIREEGAVVGVGVDPYAQDLAIPAQGQFPLEVLSRAKPVEVRLPVLSSTHFTGRASRMEPRMAMRYPCYGQVSMSTEAWASAAVLEYGVNAK